MSSPLQTYTKLTSLSAHMSELRASRVFAWRSVPDVRCVRVSQQHLPPAAVYTLTHTNTRTHFLIMPSVRPRQRLLFTLQRTRDEHPLGGIRRLKAKVADNIFHHVTAGRALSIAHSQRQCTAPGRNLPVRLFMGQGSSVIKHPTRRDDRKVPTSEASHWSSVKKHYQARRS